jgi:Na+/proline symporter
LFNVLTNGLFSVNVGMWMLSIVVFLYVASGGLRAVAYVDTVQCLLLAGGIAVIGIIGISYAGGWSALNQGIANLTSIDKKLTADGYSHYIAIPGVIQFVKSGPPRLFPCGRLPIKIPNRLHRSRYGPPHWVSAAS